jgi:hypothetical protein
VAGPSKNQAKVFRDPLNVGRNAGFSVRDARRQAATQALKALGFLERALNFCGQEEGTNAQMLKREHLRDHRGGWP